MEHGLGERVEFRLLGPLEVEQDGHTLAVGGRRQRHLSRLLPPPPKRGRPSRAPHRRSLGRASSGEGRQLAPGGRTRAPQAARRRPDRHPRRGLLPASRSASSTAALRGAHRTGPSRGSPAAAAETFARRSHLRGGRRCRISATAFAAAERGRLEAQPCAVEDRIAAELAIGRHTELVPELEGLVAEHPHRERHGVSTCSRCTAWTPGRSARCLSAGPRNARRARIEREQSSRSSSGQSCARIRACTAGGACEEQRSCAADTPRGSSARAGRPDLPRSEPRRSLADSDRPGGTGKTRLALEGLGADLDSRRVLRRPRSDRRSGAGRHQVLGVAEVDEQLGRLVIETLGDGRRRLRLLLLFDNFEGGDRRRPTRHRAAAAAPGLKALVTSRVAHVSGEHEYPVPPLAVPDLEHDDEQALARNEAVEPSQPAPAPSAPGSASPRRTRGSSRRSASHSTVSRWASSSLPPAPG